MWDDAGLLTVEKRGLSGILDLRSAYSSIELPKLLSEGCHFELIYVDGSHLVEDVFLDAFYSVRLLREGGVVAVDDCADSHVAKVIGFIRKNLSNAMAELDLSPYRADGGRSWLYKVGGWLGHRQMRAFRRTGEVVRPWNAAFRNF